MEPQLKDHLEALLNIPGLVLQLTEEGDSLIVVLNRSQPHHLDYVTIVDRVIDEIELNLLPYKSVQFYSRVLGEEEPDWTRTIPLGQQRGTATVIISSSHTLHRDSGKTHVIDNEEQEEEFNLPKPRLPQRQPHKPQPARPAQKPAEVAAPTVMAPRTSEPPKKEDEEVAAETQVVTPSPPARLKPPEPVPNPVPASPLPWRSVLLAGAVVVVVGAAGWLLWHRNQSKPKKASTMPYVVFCLANRDVGTANLFLCRC
ncbi:MAG: hypothetical protein RMK91_04610 [Pseudanabaenaceae cyanobacterium SKYGB_i_bin29]|nr:hypothetical protein [Pseudanabaenaceae cyanobacterium SKYG29]MDW8421126.1 hypothetical protein [Pseudanabaenaceae cyanobacterium SKYGB_i_bin29]